MSSTDSDDGELKLADFDCGKKIGEGTYGTVHYATYRGSRARVALKQIRINGYVFSFAFWITWECF